MVGFVAASRGPSGTCCSSPSPPTPSDFPIGREPARAALATAIGATATAAASISVLQLFAGDVLLPRFVVLGSAVILVPWYVLCSFLARDAETRATERDRVIVVAEPDEVASLVAELGRAPEPRPMIVGSLAIRECDVNESAADADRCST